MSMRWLTDNSLSQNNKSERLQEPIVLEDGDKMRKKNWVKRMSIVAMSTLLAASVAGCSLLPNELEEEDIPTITPPKLAEKPTYSVKTDTIVLRARGNGKIMSMKEESMFFTLEGSYRIAAIYVENGQEVNAGDPIAELDVVDLQNSLRTERLLFKKKEEEMKRTLRLADTMSDEEFEQAKIDFELARTKLLEIEEKIQRSTIVAPFSGTIVSISANPGDSVQAYAPIAVIADTSQMTVAVTISKEDLKQVAVGMGVEVDINAAGSHKGKVKRLPMEEQQNNNNPWDPWNPQQPQKDSIDKYVLVELDQFPAEVTRNTPLSASIITDRKENVVVIPPSTLRTYGGRTYVQIVENDGTKREVDVQVGTQTSTQIEIVTGLEPGMKVVGK